MPIQYTCERCHLSIQGVFTQIKKIPRDTNWYASWSAAEDAAKDARDASRDDAGAKYQAVWIEKALLPRLPAPTSLTQHNYYLCESCNSIFLTQFTKFLDEKDID